MADYGEDGEDEFKAPPATYTNGLRFSALCDTLEAVQNLRKAQDKIEALLTSQLLLARQRGETLFPLFRLLLPQLDRHRNVYGLKEKSLAVLYTKILGLTKQSPDYQTLVNYRDPTKSRYGAASGSNSHVGDFGATLEVVLRRRANQSTGLTIGKINELLDQLYTAADADAKQQVLQVIVKQCSAREQKWITRIVLKDLKIGLKHERMLKYYHPDAMEAYNANTNLEAVCADPNLRDPRVRSKQQMKINVPFQPMLCMRKAWNEGDRVMGTDTFFIEDKMDGERMLLHKSGMQILMYSRKCTDYSMYGEQLRREILENVDADQCILDGEMLAWDSSTQCYIPFGKNKTAFASERDNPDSTTHLCYVVFDVLWLTGREDIPEARGCLADLPLERRRQILASVVKECPHRLEVLPYITVCASSAKKRLEAIMTRFAEVVDERKEGLVMKEASSKYTCAARDERWVKLKPDYVGGFNRTFDCLVVGGYYGDGRRRSGQISHFLLALSAEERKQGVAPKKFVSFTKVGSGYNMSELRQLQGLLRDHWQPVPSQSNNMPPYLCGWKPAKRDDKPHVVIDDPANSILLEVYGAELVPTTQFSSKHTLRFPRVHRLRTDKEWYEVDTLQMMEELLRERAGQTAMNDIVGRGGAVSWNRAAKKKRRRGDAATSRNVAPRIVDAYAAADLSGVERTEGEAGIFAGAQLCVMVDNYKPFGTSKQGLERLIHKHHGKCVQNPMDSTDYVIAASSKKLKVANLIHTNAVDVVSASWVLACIEAGVRKDLEPRYLIHTCPKTRFKLRKSFDDYGDHYTRLATTDDVTTAFAAMNEQRGRPVTDADVAAAVASLDKEERAALVTESSLFNDCEVYVHGMRSDGSVSNTHDAPDVLLMSALPRTAFQVAVYGGTVLDSVAGEFTDRVTHVVVDPDRTAGLDEVIDVLFDANRDVSTLLVRHEWVAACVKAGRLVPTTGFHLPLSQ